MGVIEEQHAYYERLLSLQFMASEQIKHGVTKGTLRENFIKEWFQTVLPSYEALEGILSKGSWQSTQGDFIKLRPNSIQLNKIYQVEDCLIFMEIKSNATRKHFEYLNTIATELKRKNDEILVGIFCYTTSSSKKTIFKNFGIYYDKTIDAFNNHNIELDLFPEIDYCFSLNVDKKNYINPKAYFLNREKGKETKVLLLFLKVNTELL
ncbi:hypothetical protein Q0G00_03320 [Brochothrix thermosphacta]|nr:DUF6602 domain-containing protein [Brochothrix thermosphacta]WKK69666.1 hypothetical protein Q0G00_03320 [Brochothrix thermosphacta]